MKKEAVAMEQVRFKQEEIKKLLNDNLTKMRSLITPAMSPNQIAAQINTLLVPLNEAINRKVLELTSLIPPAGTTTQPAEAKDQIIPGGMGADLKPEDVDPKQLEMGIKVELEHTGDKDMAQEIALDHLAEDPKYYTHLKKVHQDSRDNHLGPRGKKQNKNLPDFWCKNLDYGESPYMHLDKIKTITDRPISKRKKKKK